MLRMVQQLHLSSEKGHFLSQRPFWSSKSRIWRPASQSKIVTFFDKIMKNQNCIVCFQSVLGYPKTIYLQGNGLIRLRNHRKPSPKTPREPKNPRRRPTFQKFEIEKMEKVSISKIWNFGLRRLSDDDFETPLSSLVEVYDGFGVESDHFLAYILSLDILEVIGTKNKNLIFHDFFFEKK